VTADGGTPALAAMKTPGATELGPPRARAGAVRAGAADRVARLARSAARTPQGVLGGLIILALLVVALLAPKLARHGPRTTDFDAYLPPSRQFPLGTDHLGRDVLSRIVWGARLSLYVGVVSVAVGVTAGALVGAVTAYVGGLADLLSQHVVDALMALPPIALALALMATLGPSAANVILVLTIILLPTAARTIRPVALAARATPFVEAARATGSSHVRIIRVHILPSTLPTYVVLVAVNMGYAMVMEAALSFLGIGTPPDEPSWGGMVTAGVAALNHAPWLVLFPSLAISLAVLGLNLLGDAIRDATDPRLRDGPG
jgi:ABC-type dipeptide/oligopeptide/nickel transport system permease subunit